MHVVRQLLALVRGRPMPPSSDGPDPARDAGVPAESDPVRRSIAVAPIGVRPRDRAPFAVLLLAAITILWVARGVLGPFVVAAVLAYAFSPLVTAGQERLRWPRPAVVGLGYAIVAAIVTVLGILLARRIGHELDLFAGGGPDSLAKALRDLVGSDVVVIGGQRLAVIDVAHEIQARVAGLVSSPGDALHLAGQAGEIGLQAILALIVTFYFLVDGAMFIQRTIALLPVQHRGRTREVLARIHVTLGRWLRGQILLIGLVAAVAYVGLGPIAHLPYALALAALTGFLEIIPLIGPLIATGIVAVDAFAHGGAGLTAAVVVFYFVLRQVEDQVVMPVVIGRAVHLHPVVTIFAVLVGLSLYGVLGGLLGVPIAAAVNVVFRELYPAQPERPDVPPVPPLPSAFPASPAAPTSSTPPGPP